MALNKINKKLDEGNTTVAEEAKKVSASASATAPVVSYDETKLGIKSDKIEFIAPLGDPSKIDVVKNKETGTETKTPYIIGYRFKALEDMVVPECGLADDARNNLMSYKDKTGTKNVKAGEEFDLTRFETGLLLAPEEFNGVITGGGKEVRATFTSSTPRTKDGRVAKATAADSIPTVALKLKEGSIKDVKIIEVLTFTEEVSPDGKSKRKHRTIIKGFEKWEPLCIERAPVTGSRGTSTPKNRRNDKAQAFLDIVSKK